MSDKNEVKDISTAIIHDLIDECDLTREEIGKATGMDTSTVTKYYNGDRKLTLEAVRKFSKFFNVSSDYILDLTKIKTANTDLKAVCEYTGLNEEAVVTLREFVRPKPLKKGEELPDDVFLFLENRDKCFSEVVSEIISSEEFISGVGKMANLKCKYFNDFTTAEIASDLLKSEKKIFENYLSLKLDYFEASTHFDDIVRNICEVVICEVEEKLFRAAYKITKDYDLALLMIGIDEHSREKRLRLKKLADMFPIEDE